jgi:hypothetical protein
MQGAAEPPGDVFLRVADILCDLALEEAKRPHPAGGGQATTPPRS